jgi:hypothetical protein
MSTYRTESREEGSYDKAKAAQDAKSDPWRKKDSTQQEIQAAAKKAAAAAPNPQSNGDLPYGPKIEELQAMNAWYSRTAYKGMAWQAKAAVSKPWLKDLEK